MLAPLLINRLKGKGTFSLQPILLALLFAGTLSISFLDHDYFYLTWFAFIPLLFAVEGAGLVKTYLIGLIGGFVCYLIGMYWIVDFIIISKGYHLGKSILIDSLYWFYCAHLIAGALVALGWLKRYTNIHEFILFPVVVATFTSCFPMLFAMRLGESQVNFQTALQAIEFTGVHGLDFIIALVNIVIFRCLYRQIFKIDKTQSHTRFQWYLPGLLIGAWFTFGLIQYPLWQTNIAQWDTLKVGIVQPDEEPQLGRTKTYPGFSYAYPPEMSMTERLASVQAELVVWPEGQAKNYLNNTKVKQAFQRSIKNAGTNVLFHDMQHTRKPSNGELLKQTSTAIFIDDTGTQHTSYIKMKRIPFGEYIPFTDAQSIVGTWVKRVFDNFLIETVEGNEHRLFKHEKLNIVPLICYETTSPSFVGQAIKNTTLEADPTKGSLIIALSNDGWFGSTHQPYQHVMPSILRAIENRLPLIHVANNGPSIAVVPSGDVIFTSDFQSPGGYLVDVSYSHDERGSFYSKYPKVFDYALYSLMIGLLINALFRLTLNRKHPS